MSSAGLFFKFNVNKFLFIKGKEQWYKTFTLCFYSNYADYKFDIGCDFQCWQ